MVIIMTDALYSGYVIALWILVPLWILWKVVHSGPPATSDKAKN
jgi:hypothetical protein